MYPLGASEYKLSLAATHSGESTTRQIQPGSHQHRFAAKVHQACHFQPSTFEAVDHIQAIVNLGRYSLLVATAFAVSTIIIKDWS